jgi:hypothetical protein
MIGGSIRWGRPPLCQKSELLEVTILSHNRIRETQSRTLLQDYNYGSRSYRLEGDVTLYGPILRMVVCIQQAAESLIRPLVNLSW